MPVYLSLGSNMGNRNELLRQALTAVAAVPSTRLLRVSSVYETAPWGEANQPAFLNLAAEIETALAPLEFLRQLQTIETRLGRTTTYRWGPRAIDIDIVLWDEREMVEKALVLPHPQFRERRFVLEPLAEIAPDAMDPTTGQTVAQLAKSTGAHGQVTRRDDIQLTP